MNGVALKNVTFSYDGKSEILSHIDFTACHGEVALVAGHSGEGKSTLMSIIGGIIPNVTQGNLSGDVIIDGENMNGKRLGDICRKVGVVLQNADEQIIHKTVEDEIAFGLENLAFPAEKIAKQIDVVCNLMNLDKTWQTRTLSGGQKQRLITASTLAMGQKIIILDEPLANLDRAGGEQLMSTLRSLARAGYCVIVVEHRLDVVLPFVDKVWHIGGGKVTLVEDKAEYLRRQTERISDICKAYAGGMPALEVKNIAFSVKGREILKDVTFTVNKGERVVLLGENGCGKTTLMRLIARLNKPTGGSVLQNFDPKLKQKTKGDKAWFQKVGVVYQNPDYQLFMPTVWQEIEFSAISKEYAERMTELFHLRHLKDRHPQSLSEGQKRRVSIAAVMAAKPELLLLDEPTVGQDYKGLCELVEILNTLHNETGNTMITVTHDKRCVSALCDKAVVIENGKVKAQGGKALAQSFLCAVSDEFPREAEAE
jgi:energy-coupling factor transport system ATP-binding protein